MFPFKFLAISEKTKTTFHFVNMTSISFGGTYLF